MSSSSDPYAYLSDRSVSEQEEEEEEEEEMVEDAAAARLTPGTRPPSLPHSVPSFTQAEEQRAHERRPLGPGFRGTNKQTREGGGLPEGETIPAGIPHDLVLQFDLPARRMEREERLLAMNGGDVNETLELICNEGGGKDARFLLAHGANANHEAHDEWSVLEKAAECGHVAVVEALLDAGAYDFDYALQEAASNGHTAVAALLLDRGADIHFQFDWALNSAAFGGHLETATLLLDRGADPNAPPDVPGGLTTSLRTARQNGHHHIAALLLQRGAVDEDAA